MINLDSFLNQWLLVCEPVTNKYEYYYLKKIDGIRGDDQNRYWYWGLQKDHSYEPIKICLAKADFSRFDLVAEDAVEYINIIPDELHDMYEELWDFGKVPSIPEFIDLCIKYDLAISSSAFGGKIVSLNGEYLTVQEYAYLGAPVPYANTGVVNINDLTYIAAMYHSANKQRADAYDRNNDCVQSLNDILKK